MKPAGGECPFIGRSEDLAVLRAALLKVEHGETAAVFVVGDSGVGKTRLLAAAGEEMSRAGAVVLSGSCLDIGDASPLHPLRQALLRVSPEWERARPVAAPALRELMEILDGEATSSDGAGALLERLSRGLGTVADGRILVLIMDDLQWADRTTRQLLLYLLAGLGGVQLLLLGAVRAESLHGCDPLRLMLMELRRLRSVRLVELSPLGQAETERLATAIVGGPLDPAAMDLVWTRSGGNPFFVEELARDARDGRVGLSDTLREIVLARVALLPLPARTVVSALAAAVKPVEHELLARVVDLEEVPLIQAIRTAVDKRILVAAEEGYWFHHRLIKEVLEPGLLPGERVRLHRRYAEALSTRSSGRLQNASLAYHWRLAGERARSLQAAMAAAEDAERLHGLAEAFHHWTDALELARELRGGESVDVDMTVLWQSTAEAGHRCGEHERALALLEEPGAYGAAPPPWGVYIRRARYLAALGRLTEAEVEYERALKDDRCTAPDKATAAAHSAELLLLLGRHADAGKRACEALELARGVEDSASSMVLAGAVLGASQAYLDDPTAGVVTVRDALRTAERLGGLVDIARTYVQLAELLTGPLNELEEGVAVARHGADRAERDGLGRTYGTRLLAVAANGLFRLGWWAQAEEVIAAAFRHRPSGADAVELLLARCRVRIGYGDLDAAERDLEAIDTLLAAGGGARHILPLLTLRAGLAMWRGRPGEARDAIQRGLDLAESRSDDVWLQAPLVWHGLRAEAEARSGGAEPDGQAVRRLCQVAECIARDSATAAGPVREAVTGYQELCSAEISRLEGRSEPSAWARAAAAWERRKHPYPAAYARLRQAEALFAQRTRNAEATHALQDAYRTATDLGAHPFLEEIRGLAERARVPLPERPASGPPVSGEHGAPRQPGAASPATAAGTPSAGRRAYVDELAVLTNRELQVLARVAAGDRNREIAQLLYISPRTVGVHITHILEKLGVRTRVQATAIYQRNQHRRQ